MANRRQFFKTSLQTALELATVGMLTSSVEGQAIGRTPQDDEGGYEISGHENGEHPRAASLGKPAPDWLNSADVYNGWYAAWSEETLQTRLKGFPLVVGVPHSSYWIRKAHQLRIRVIPYISFYKCLNISAAKKAGWPDPQGFLMSPLFRELDLGKHPEWLLYDKEGKVRRPFNRADYPGGWEQVCTAAPGFIEAALRGIRGLLELGADGFFIDNIHPTSHCHGPAFGKHTHANGMDNGEAFRDLITDVYALVKKNSSTKIVVLNPGHVNPIYWPSCDAMMYESYVCSGATYTCSHNWDPILQKAKACQQALQSGKAVLTLSYMGAPSYDVGDPSSHETSGQPPSKEDAFYCYACSRISGFLWADWFTLPPNHPGQVLYKVRLGRPLGALEQIEGIYLRRFRRGIVVVNPSEERKHIRITRIQTSELRDIFAGKIVEVNGASLSVEITGQSGRVFASS
jgi:putative glycosyl hydrolase-like family 15 (GHL15) protein